MALHAPAAHLAEQVILLLLLCSWFRCCNDKCSATVSSSTSNTSSHHTMVMGIALPHPALHAWSCMHCADPATDPVNPGRRSVHLWQHVPMPARHCPPLLWAQLVPSRKSPRSRPCCTLQSSTLQNHRERIDTADGTAAAKGAHSSGQLSPHCSHAYKVCALQLALNVNAKSEPSCRTFAPTTFEHRLTNGWASASLRTLKQDDEQPRPPHAPAPSCLPGRPDAAAGGILAGVHATRHRPQAGPPNQRHRPAGPA